MWYKIGQESRKRQVAKPGGDAQPVVVIGQDAAARANLAAGSGLYEVDLYKANTLESNFSLKQAQIWQPRYCPFLHFAYHF